MTMPVPSPTTTLAATGSPGFDWSVVGNIATTVGVLIALWVALSGARRQRKIDHRDQASRISVFQEPRYSKAGGYQYNVAIILNSSSAPIYSVVVGSGHMSWRGDEFRPGNDNSRFVAVVPPGRYSIQAPGGLHGETRVTDVNAYGDESVEEVESDRRGLTITFRDGEDVTWQRNARGRLTETKGEPARLRDLSAPLPHADLRSE